MKPTAFLVAATVAVALAACQNPIPMDGQVDCADWNTYAFFETSEALDVTRCLQAGADPNARDGIYGGTPLHAAARSNTNPGVIVALHEAGADPNAQIGTEQKVRDGIGLTPWRLAQMNDALEGTDALRWLNDFYYQSKTRPNEVRSSAADTAASSSVDLGTNSANATLDARESEAAVFSVGGDVTTPAILTQVLPEYSPEARAVEYQGTVVLETIVRRDGTVEVVQVTRSLPFGLDEKAIEAVTQWRFRPGMRNGEPVDVALKIEINFNLR